MISIVTLINKPELYNKNVVASFKATQAELIPIYYPTNACKGLNEGITKANHNIILLCHQDVAFPDNWITNLYNQISLINDECWGVLGTAGYTERWHLTGNIKSGDKYIRSGILPCIAMTLDEHCLIIKKDSGLRFDETIDDDCSFHWYGTDICLSAYQQGMNCYVINNFLHHLSDNPNRDDNFKKAEKWIVNKWTGKSKFKRIYTTCCGKGLRL